MANFENGSTSVDLDDILQWVESQLQSIESRRVDLSNAKESAEKNEYKRALENMESIEAQKNLLKTIREQCEKFCLDVESIDSLLSILDTYRSNIKVPFENEKQTGVIDGDWEILDENMESDNYGLLSEANSRYEANKWLIDTEISNILETVKENIEEVSKILKSVEVTEGSADSDLEEDTNRWKKIFLHHEWLWLERHLLSQILQIK